MKKSNGKKNEGKKDDKKKSARKRQFYKKLYMPEKKKLQYQEEKKIKEQYKRMRLSENDVGDEEEIKDVVAAHSDAAPPKHKKMKPTKASQERAQMIEENRELERTKLEKEKKKKKRKEQSKSLKKRTSKGQLILGNEISRMLEKIEKTKK